MVAQEQPVGPRGTAWDRLGPRVTMCDHVGPLGPIHSELIQSNQYFAAPACEIVIIVLMGTSSGSWDRVGPVGPPASIRAHPRPSVTVGYRQAHMLCV